MPACHAGAPFAIRNWPDSAGFASAFTSFLRSLVALATPTMLDLLFLSFDKCYSGLLLVIFGPQQANKQRGVQQWSLLWSSHNDLRSIFALSLP